MSDVIHEEEALGKVYDTRLIALLWKYVSPYGWQVALTLFMALSPCRSLPLSLFLSHFFWIMLYIDFSRPSTLDFTTPM